MTSKSSLRSLLGFLTLKFLYNRNFRGAQESELARILDVFKRYSS